jgi:hypothetical protein
MFFFCHMKFYNLCYSCGTDVRLLKINHRNNHFAFIHKPSQFQHQPVQQRPVIAKVRNVGHAFRIHVSQEDVVYARVTQSRRFRVTWRHRSRGWVSLRSLAGYLTTELLDVDTSKNCGTCSIGYWIDPRPGLEFEDSRRNSYLCRMEPVFVCGSAVHPQDCKGKAIPLQTLRVPGGWGSQISRQSAHEGGKVVSPTHRPSLPQEIFLVLIYVRGWVEPRAIIWPEGLCQWKIPMTPSGIGPTTLRLVARCLTPQHCTHWNIRHETFV